MASVVWLWIFEMEVVVSCDLQARSAAATVRMLWKRRRCSGSSISRFHC